MGQNSDTQLSLNVSPACVRIDTAGFNNVSLPIINCNIGKLEVKALIDSGAAVNIISQKIVDKLKQSKCDYSFSSCSLKILGITNSQMFIDEQIEVNIQLGKRIIKTKFCINPSVMNNYDCIFGLEFLVQNNIVIDCENYYIRNNDFKIKWEGNFNNDKTTSVNVCDLDEVLIGYTTNKHVIPPRSELIIKIHTKDHRLNSELALIQPTRHSLESSWVVSHSVNTVNDKGEFFVKVANFSKESIHINKGIKLVSIEPVEPVTSEEKEVNIVEKDLEHDFDLYGGQFNLDHLKGDQKVKLLELLKKHAKVFANNVKQLTGCSTIAHRVYLTDEVPIKQKPYRTPHALKDELKNQINDLLDAGIISISDSPYASPIILVKKKNNSYRLVCDYRKLNLKTQPLPFPLPLITDLLDSLEGAKFYSSLDLCSGYWQMELDPKDRHKTAFCTEFGLYHWNRLPQGLKNAASSFQRLLEVVLAGLKEWNISTYLDDLIIASNTFEEHLQKLDMVFKRLDKHNLKVNPSKCQLVRNEITYLGFQVKEGKILPETRNIEAVKNFPIPINKKQVRSFLGLCNFYRKFIKDFASIALPLTNLTKGKTNFKWDEKAEKAFNQLKHALISYPCLILPDVNKDFVLHTDASGQAIGAVLSQKGEDGLLHPISYASKRLKDAETRYSTFERETLAVVWGINNFRQYLYGRKFKLFCDQKSLSYALKLKDSGRVTRWALSLQNYDFEIEHIPGKNNIPADVLSRQINSGEVVDDETSIQPFPLSRLKALQAADVKCRDILDKLTVQQEYELNEKIFYKKGEILYCLNKSDSSDNVEKLVVPKTLITEVLTLAHDSPTVAHPGFKRTLERVKKSYFWWGIYKHVLNFIKSCISCCERRGYKSNQKAPLQRIVVTERPFQRIGMDAIGPLPITDAGNRHIIVISDYFTRWAEAYPVPDLKSETISHILEKFICTHGVPEQLLTDRGSSFLSEGIQKVYNKLNIKKLNTTSYHPSTDGVVERVNATIINALKHLIQSTENEWDRYLHFALLAHRSAIHSALNDTPAHLIYGRDIILPVDIIAAPVKRSYADYRDFSEELELRLHKAFKLVKDNLTKAAERQEQYRAKFFKDKDIRVGDMVMLYTPVVKPGQSKKFTKTNKGIYRVKKQTSPVNFEIVQINKPNDRQLVHIDRLTKLHERIIFPSLPLDTNDNFVPAVEGEQQDLYSNTHDGMILNETKDCETRGSQSKQKTFKFYYSTNREKGSNKVIEEESENGDNQNLAKETEIWENEVSLENSQIENNELNTEVVNKNTTLDQGDSNQISEKDNCKNVHDDNDSKTQDESKSESQNKQVKNAQKNKKASHNYELRPRNKQGFVE